MAAYFQAHPEQFVLKADVAKKSTYGLLFAVCLVLMIKPDLIPVGELWIWRVIAWIGMGFAYKSIHSHRPFRDSVTDATNGIGQLLMTGLYREQWLFWIATNLFSIYLWWGENIHIQGMYWVYTLNSLVGWYQWTKAVRKEA